MTSASRKDQTLSMDTFSQRFKNTAFVRLFAFWKIPLLWWVQPTVIEMSENRTELKIPLTRRTKNHLNSMYFGALGIGAEVAIAAIAVKTIADSKKPVDFLFKDFSGKFLKRGDGDVHFICDQGQAVKALIHKAIASGEREEGTFQSYAIVPKTDPTAHIGEFTLTMSCKLRQKKPKV